MGSLIDDQMVDAFAVVAPWTRLPERFEVGVSARSTVQT
jgi:hypothetical protein